MTADLKALCVWSKVNGLDLNAFKTQAIVFCDGENPLVLPGILLNGALVEISAEVMNFGLKLTSNLGWRNQCNAIAGKVFAGLRTLWQSVSSVKSMLFPYFTREIYPFLDES